MGPRDGGLLGLVVGGERLAWAEGSALCFDDSFEHAVFHAGSAPRLVLILDILHPDILARPRGGSWTDEALIAALAAGPRSDDALIAEAGATEGGATEGGGWWPAAPLPSLGAPVSVLLNNPSAYAPLLKRHGLEPPAGSIGEVAVRHGPLAAALSGLLLLLAAYWRWVLSPQVGKLRRLMADRAAHKATITAAAASPVVGPAPTMAGGRAAGPALTPAAALSRSPKPQQNKAPQKPAPTKK